MQHDGLIFDLDGTLWNTTKECALAWNRILEEKKIEHRPLTADDMAGAMGLPEKEFAKKLLPDLPAQVLDLLPKPCFEEELRVIQAAEHSLLYPDVAESLCLLAEKTPLFIVSNSEHSYIETFLAVTGLGPQILDFESHGRTGKQKAQNIRMVADRNELQHPVYMGDTARDQEEASKAGVAYVHANWGFGKPTQPCLSFDRFKDLTEHFAR